ncbi:hypothetical protein HBB16_02745 [Pseudonocardia sp. MCCB 268]|nr:hypothetical protein [Pseudonocardia cytotoxica]
MLRPPFDARTSPDRARHRSHPGHARRGTRAPSPRARTSPGNTTPALPGSPAARPRPRRAVRITREPANIGAMVVASKLDVTADRMVSWLPAVSRHGDGRLLTVPMTVRLELVTVTDRLPRAAPANGPS